MINSHATTIVGNISNLNIQSDDISDVSSNILIQANNEPKFLRSPTLYNIIDKLNRKNIISYIPVATDSKSN